MDLFIEYPHVTVGIFGVVIIYTTLAIQKWRWHRHPLYQEIQAHAQERM